jgi:hypothetical protein
MMDAVPVFPTSRKLFGGVIISKASKLEAGWFNEQTFSEDDDPFNAHETKTTDYRYLEEPAFYDDRQVEYNENPWFAFLHDYLTGELFSDYEFDGPGADEVREFFDKTCPNAREEIEKMGLNVVREGTGMLKKAHDGNGKLVQIHASNGRLIRLREHYMEMELMGIPTSRKPPFPLKLSPGGAPYTQAPASVGDSVDPAVEALPGPDATITTKYLEVTMLRDAKWRVNLKLYPIVDRGDYVNYDIALCRIREDPRTPYGIAFGRAAFHDLKALRGINRDIIASIKRLAAVLLVLKANLKNYRTDDLKAEALLQAVKMFEDMDSASTGVIAIDNENELGYPEGNRTDRLIPVMQHLEPVLSSVLMNFLFALGIIEQTGANKSLIAKQEIRAEKQLRRYQQKVARWMEVHIFSEITSKECHVRFNSYLDPELWKGLWDTSAVSRERIQREYAIIDEGKTFANDLAIKLAKAGAAARPTPGASSKKPDSSKDDSADKGHRTGGKSDETVTKGRG